MLLFQVGCSTTRRAEDKSTHTDVPVVIYGDRLVAVNHPLSLADFLIRVPGVHVTRTKVTIRGQHSPLFVIDDVQIGHNYTSAEQAVSVFDIQSVEVLRSLTETAIYGTEGVNGVIIIRTKRPDFRDENVESSQESI